MVELKQKQILIDNKPVLIMCGEIHYFRLQKKEWLDRIKKLKLSGCNAVASYVPWVMHEEIYEDIDWGNRRPELDLAAFIDLCAENDLYFFVRPGPFIMAEMKNEGIPYWMYDRYPETIPTGWNKDKATTKTLDYLSPNFLKEVKRWYSSVMEIVRPRLQTNGGNIIAFQLDNEIGMLSWVSNTPDLTDFVIQDFNNWLMVKYSEELILRYQDIDFNDFNWIREPEESYTSKLHFDLGYYMRYRFAKYVRTLRRYAEVGGVLGIPFVVNIHGTGAGRGFTFPIGISQLFETYAKDSSYLSGSDIYFGDLTMENFQDLYIINGFMDAMHNEDQPLSSVEFNCGDGNFGETYGNRTDPSAADLKARMCIAQGNRLLNYYLMTGGYNHHLEIPVNDGNNRVAFTGQRHGFAAPIDPEGNFNYTFPRMVRSIKTMMSVEDKIATMIEERDNLAFAFVPDYFMTEYKYPQSQKMEKIYANIQSNRAYGAWEILGRAMLLANYRFGSIDIQNKNLNPIETPVLVFACAQYLHKSIQEKLVKYLEVGGKVFVYGELPLFDLYGNDCTILIDYLGLTYNHNLRDGHEFYLSTIATNWAAPNPEIRIHHAQTFNLSKGQSLFEIYGTNEICGFDIPAGKGRLIGMTMSYRCDIPLFKKILTKLGTTPKLTHDEPDHGIFMTSTINNHDERFIHILNLDGFDKAFQILENEKPIFDNQIFELSAREGIMLPVGVKFDKIEIIKSTAEITNVDDFKIQFRLTQSEDTITIKTSREILASNDYDIFTENDIKTIVSKKHSKVDNQLEITFGE